MSIFSTSSSRLEAFSDGVLAVIITIMVLELRAPATTELRSIVPVLPNIAIYALSFVFIGIYWNNHHHMLRATTGINGRVMWANLNLLFWLSLIPFGTAWLGENPTAAGPTVFYCFIFFLNGLAYWILQRSLIAVNGNETPFARAVSSDVKGRFSIGLYLLSIAVAFFLPILSEAILVLVAIIWIVPDRRFEPLIATNTSERASS